MKEELLKGLTEEQIAKVKACKNEEEILKLAKEEGVELTDEQLEAVSGGCGTMPNCPYCGSNNLYYMRMRGFVEDEYHCNNSGKDFKVSEAVQG